MTNNNWEDRFDKEFYGRLSSNTFDEPEKEIKAFIRQELEELQKELEIADKRWQANEECRQRYDNLIVESNFQEQKHQQELEAEYKRGYENGLNKAGFKLINNLK